MTVGTGPAGRRPRRGWWERVLFTFMGPPQLGDHRAPATYRPDAEAELCHTCAQPWDRHERVSTSSMTYVRCPVPQR